MNRVPLDSQSTIVCVLDELNPTGGHGWAVDAALAVRHLKLHVIIDREDVGEIACDQPRPDLKDTGYPTNVGYTFTIPERFLDDIPHRLEIRTREQPNEPLTFIHAGRALRHIEFRETARPRTWSHVDDLDAGAIIGWVLREDASGSPQGGNTLLVTCEHETAGMIKANRFRPDIATAREADAYCGFRFIPPDLFRRARPQSFRFFLLPEKIELLGSPFVTSFMTDTQAAKLTELRTTLDHLEREIIRARQQLKSLTPRRACTLHDYDAWARRYFATLRARTGPSTSQPLVSILCPTFNPDMGDFTAAVESVLAQTYRNWELIIVDDASRRPELRAQIKAFERRDPRIRGVTRRCNGGISAATNTALEKASGEWIAFFDHDDLLVGEALEMMLAQALQSGADMVYSDEDKIDPTGHLSEPHFKPDWNSRLLLANNYVCHLLIVRRDLLDRVGPLNSAYDGAQDHDLVLRLGEAAKHIQHVPEVLYHWRKTARSTAADPQAKPYVVDAGCRAVGAALQRRRLRGRVESRLDTCYRIDWQFSTEPKVAIVVPFRDAAETTQRCIDSIVQATAYANYEIILVDNWSTEPTTAALLASVTDQHDRVRVLRIEEDFNYSRLNNRAAASTDADFLLLLNNDVFHADPEWLRRLVNDAIADPTVAVVGAKLLYPSGAVQHAGVLLGMWGIAGHMHSGLPATAPGYMARAILTQEVSAVTGACMLIRASVYRDLGGLDEVNLPVGFSDVDFCLRARQAGHKVIYCADCVAEHHESMTRGADDQPAKEARFRSECRMMEHRWGSVLRHDPFYNRHFDLDGEPFMDLAEDC